MVTVFHIKHDDGTTAQVIAETFEDACSALHWHPSSVMEFGVSQRERVVLEKSAKGAVNIRALFLPEAI